jgi:hypothetical protein
LSLLVLVVASVAVIASSPPFSELIERRDGDPFELDRENPVVRVPFEFYVTEPAREESWSFALSIGVVWRGVPESEQRLTVSLVDSKGQEVIKSSGATSLYLTCREECLGGGEFLAEWPIGIAAGEATVTWSATAMASFDRDQPPDGAAISLAVGSPPRPSQSVLLISESADTSRVNPDIVMRRRVGLTARDLDAEYWLELQRVGYGPYKTSFFVVIDQSTTRLAAGESIRLSPPVGCAAPCHWTVDVVVVDESQRANGGGGATWGIRQVGGSETGFARPATILPVPSTAIHLSGTAISIEGDNSLSIPVRLEVAPEAMTVDDFRAIERQVLVTLEANVDPATSSFRSGARLDVRIDGYPQFGSTASLSADLTPHPATTPARLECRASGCVLDFAIEFETADFRRGAVTFDWELNVELSYPFADTVPAGADMELTLR